VKPRERNRSDEKQYGPFSEPQYCLTGSWNCEKRRPILGPQHCFTVQEGSGILGKMQTFSEPLRIESEKSATL
jgi:hypothetical protein